MFSESREGHMIRRCEDVFYISTRTFVLVHNDLSFCVTSGAHDRVSFIAALQGNVIHIHEDVPCFASEV